MIHGAQRASTQQQVAISPGNGHQPRARGSGKPRAGVRQVHMESHALGFRPTGPAGLSCSTTRHIGHMYAAQRGLNTPQAGLSRLTGLSALHNPAVCVGLPPLALRLSTTRRPLQSTVSLRLPSAPQVAAARKLQMNLSPGKAPVTCMLGIPGLH